ncbi:MAG: porin [Bryobacteraceae bacterium]
MRTSITLTTSALFCCFAACCLAQAPSPPATPPAGSAPPAAATPPPAPVWSVGTIDFSGLVDGYYSFNANHPASMTNQLQNFDVDANQFSLNMLKLTAQHDADPVGFRVDFGFGRAFDIIHSAELAPGIFRNIEQAYVSLKPKNAKGLEVDFGQYVTAAGAEVIETKDNWNYSRSLLFAWAIPYYHFGIRATMPFGSHFTAGVHIANGWNNVEDNNSGKTVGLMANVTGKKATWSNTFHAGPENTGTNKGWRELYDTVLLLTPCDKANFYINYDYGRNKFPVSGEAVWTGIAGAAHFQLNNFFAFSPRAEWFSDRNGFMTLTKQNLKELTLTLEGKMAEGLLARLEYREDWSDQKFFQRGSTGATTNQPTVILGVVAFFGPKR